MTMFHHSIPDPLSPAERAEVSRRVAADEVQHLPPFGYFLGMDLGKPPISAAGAPLWPQVERQPHRPQQANTIAMNAARTEAAKILTERVQLLITRGYSTVEIAAKLQITPRCAKDHKRRARAGV